MKFKTIIKASSLYSLISDMSRLAEIRIWYGERKRFLKEAKIQFKLDKSEHGSLRDYRKAFWKHRVTYSEYMYSYEFWKLNEAQRDEFISRSEMQVIYRKFGSRKVRNIFYDKVKFLKVFRTFVHRKWLVVRDSSFEDFEQMIDSFDSIAKPIEGTCGEGIYKISKSDTRDLHSLYDRCVKDNILLEECVRTCDEIEAFHPSSLNTIRVVTVSDNGACSVFGALLRMGTHGSVIDNTHAGGVFAPIDVETGKIVVEAIDANNNKYVCHPDTGKMIVGFQIPHWKDIVDTCCLATSTIPDIHFAGWDICILKNGKIEIIEGNHAPDFDGGMQAPLKVGVKQRIRQCIMDTMNVDPLEYISVWKKYKKS